MRCFELFIFYSGRVTKETVVYNIKILNEAMFTFVPADRLLPSQFYFIFFWSMLLLSIN